MNETVEKLRKGYEKLKSGGFQISEVFDYGEELGTSGELDFHFELILEDGKRPRGKRWHPEDFFRLHGNAGAEYLKRLLDSDDCEYAVCAAYLLAELLPRARFQDQAELLDKLNRALVRLSDANEPEHRRKSLIARGWVGTENELPTLETHLLNDPDPLCRAWSASSFLQMSGRVPDDALKKTSGALIACLESESDVFVRGVAVEAVQDVWKVRFGLRSSAVEERNQRAVDRAVRRALEFLKTEARKEV